MHYRHLFFDLDNTLYDFTKNSNLALNEAFENLGLLSKIESFEHFFEIYHRINEKLWEDYRNKLISKEKLRGDRFTLSLKEVGVETSLVSTDIDNEYLRIMPSKTHLFPNAIETLETLKAKGYIMHIITNGFEEVQNRKLQNTGLIRFFDKIYISELIKAPKPSREIFEYAIKSSNARKKESLMIGDSWDTDIIGAMKFGIDQVYFNYDNIEINFDVNPKPTFIINELSELISFL